MASQYRHRRTSNPATAFPTLLEPGELAVNTANRQLAVGDANGATIGAPLPLLAVRFFDVRAQYAAGEYVVQAGVLNRANTAVSPGAFNPAQWEVVAGGVLPYVRLGGDTMTGPLVLAADPAAAMQATTKQYVDGRTFADAPSNGTVYARRNTAWVIPAKGDVGLGNVDNTSDAAKPVSTAQAAAIALKADLASPTFTGDPKVPTPAAADNDTSIANTAWVRGFAAPLASPVFTGDPQAPTPALSDKDTSLATTAFVRNQGWAIGKNLLHNGAFAINQRGLSGQTVGDDTYVQDRWVLLLQSSPIGVSYIPQGETGYRQTIYLNQNSGAAQRIGIAQILESFETFSLRLKTAALGQIRVHCTAAVTVRYAVVYTGVSNDTNVISDIVNNWASTGYVAGDFFVANYAPVMMGSQAVAAGTWTTLADVSAAIPAGATNLIVFMWTEGALANGNVLQFTYAKLERGNYTTDPEFLPFAQDLAICQRFYENNYNYGTAVGTITGGSGGIKTIAGVTGAGTGPVQPTWQFQFKATKRAQPAMVFWNPQTGGTGTAADDGATNPSVAVTGVTSSWAAAFVPTPNASSTNYYLLYEAKADL